MRRRAGSLLCLTVLSLSSHLAVMAAEPRKPGCWCRIAPSFKDSGIVVERILYAKSFPPVPYVLDPECPNNTVTGIRANQDPLSNCDGAARRCPMPQLRYGVNTIEIRCEGSSGTAKYSLNDVLLIAVDTVPPRVTLDRVFPDGVVFPETSLKFSGTVLDEGIGPEMVYADLTLADPRSRAKPVHRRFSTHPAEGKWWRRQWEMDVDIGKIGPREVVATFTASDKLGNRGSVQDRGRPAPVLRFSLGVPSAHVAISSPAAGAFVASLAEVSGTADDPSGLRKIKVSVRMANPPRVWNGKGFNEAPPLVEGDIPVSGKDARWSFPVPDPRIFRHGQSYVVTVDVEGAAGARAGVRAPFVSRDEVLATVSDASRSEDEVLRAIDRIPRASTATDDEIAVLIRATYRRGDRIGSAAAIRLSKIGRPALGQLLYRLNTGDGSNVPHITNALGWMSADLQREAWPTLVDYLHSSNPYERRNGAYALGVLHARRAESRGPLIEALHDPVPVVRATAARSLWMVGVGEGRDAALPALIEMLRFGDADEGIWATMTLQELGPPAAEPLRSLLESSSTQTATSAAIALARVSSGSFATADETLPFLVRAVQSADPDFRHLGLQALSALGERARSSVPIVIAALDDSNEEVRRQATRTLVALDISSPRAREALSRALRDARLQGAAGWELGQRKGSAPEWAVMQLVEQMLGEADCSNGYAKFDGSAQALWSAGIASVPRLTEVLRTGTSCQRRVIARILEQIGPDAAAAVPALIDSLYQVEADGRNGILGALDHIRPGWVPSQSTAGVCGEYSDVRSEVAPASIEKEIVPFLIGMLREKDTEEDLHRKALEDLAYLREKASSAVPALQRLREKAGKTEATFIDDALFRIRGGKVRRKADLTGTRELYDAVAHLHLLGEVSYPPASPYPVAGDLRLACDSGRAKLRVAGGVGIRCSLSVSSSKRYVIRSGRACAVGSLKRIEGGREEDVPAPLDTLYRGGYGGSWLSPGPSFLDSSHPFSEGIDLDWGFILDRPGRYRLTVAATVQVATSTDPWHDQKGAWARAKPVTVEFDLLPRDPADSRRRFIVLNSAAARFQDASHDMLMPQSLGPLFDYAAVPALLHVIEKGGNSSTTWGAERALAYFCDKRRLHEAILKDIEAEHRPHNDDEAHSLANVLAASEAIPCRPGISASDEDYVRWDYARMRWERELKPTSPRP